MRVVAGTFGGLRLVPPGHKSRIRPTADRVREALFSSLGDRVAGASFLDLFAGTGAVGIEALSRGAGRAVFDELGREGLELLKKNLARLSPAPAFAVHKRKAEVYLATAAVAFDLVFADPPYGYDLGKLVALIGQAGVVSSSGLLVVEHTRRDRDWPVAPPFRLEQRKVYGDSCLAYLAPGGDT